ncbi:hypothetical protein [Paenarthrobacter sp. AMU7]|uniref:Uncharacterized protein n=1 Tax=Paenarthrobacter sp. AMU7 TaxID=3162492 RepID=A0AB39YP95_9MICC
MAKKARFGHLNQQRVSFTTGDSINRFQGNAGILRFDARADIPDQVQDTSALQPDGTIT